MDTKTILQSIQTKISTQLQSHIIFGPIDKSKNSQLNIQKLLAEKGYSIDPEDVWELIPTDQTENFFKKLVTQSLAYSVTVFDDDQALNLWTTILSLQKGTLNCFTNTTDIKKFIDGDSRGWFPLTKSTCDAAMVFLDDEKIIALIITDED